MEYSKGEWFIREIKSVNSENWEYNIVSKATTPFPHEETISRTTNEANAHLIASAPNLYEACKIACGFLACYEDKAHKEIADIVRQAIAKAQGG